MKEQRMKTYNQGFFRVPDPTLEEIRRGCKEIQDNWTPEERKKREKAAQPVQFTLLHWPTSPHHIVFEPFDYS